MHLIAKLETLCAIYSDYRLHFTILSPEWKKSSIHPIPQHGVTYILQSTEDPSDQIVDYNLHALHTSVVGIHVLLVYVGESKDLCNTQQ